MNASPKKDNENNEDNDDNDEEVAYDGQRILASARASTVQLQKKLEELRKEYPPESAVKAKGDAFSKKRPPKAMPNAT